ncbi:hypothetical protein JCM15765_32050 [Paradesulfitobacterium aromaticivorans]
MEFGIEFQKEARHLLEFEMVLEVVGLEEAFGELGYMRKRKLE